MSRVLSKAEIIEAQEDAWALEDELRAEEDPLARQEIREDLSILYNQLALGIA